MARSSAGLQACLFVIAFASLVSAQRGALPGSPSFGFAQDAPSGSRGAPTPKAAAPIDITGNWVSVVTEDWRWRMLVPKKGDTSSIPVSGEAKKIAEAWDPARIGEDGCKAYGAAAIMRMPGRLKISWEDDSTLKIEADAGAQVRLFHFETAATLKGDRGTKIDVVRTWQGFSVAEWERIPQPGGLGVSLQQAPPRTGTLKAVTTNMRAGYLRKNGVPYSEDAAVIEYFDRFSAYGSEWLTVLTAVDDPKYLSQQYLTSTHFKREQDASKWSPSPCEK
jgi:hypothetical protein